MFEVAGQYPESSAGLRLDVRLAGTNRDQYVRPSVRSYIGWAGLSPVAVSGEAPDAEPNAVPDPART